ncbi:hypothetical protein F3Y22_tig00113099pilonHSYRG00032 [Hibiscus syriacus]|uniref:Uncharacterized protein n=1 Tax=Hibiscus syriacus TaxID=106335 RepID=A0A6A2WR57_HIBSY|nr:hypothetical protein F3Y22_tig00113099pilonHSYRG00032 [Hibiscus syriacus]
MATSSNPNPEGSDEKQKRSEIYTYEAPWHVYAMNWSVRRDKKYGVAINSLLEQYINHLEIVHLDDSNREIRFDPNLSFDHPYPQPRPSSSPTRYARNPIFSQPPPTSSASGESPMITSVSTSSLF